MEKLPDYSIWLSYLAKWKPDEANVDSASDQPNDSVNLNDSTSSKTDVLEAIEDAMETIATLSRLQTKRTYFGHYTTSESEGTDLEDIKSVPSSMNVNQKYPTSYHPISLIPRGHYTTSESEGKDLEDNESWPARSKVYKKHSTSSRNTTSECEGADSEDSKNLPARRKVYKKHPTIERPAMSHGTDRLMTSNCWSTSSESDESNICDNRFLFPRHTEEGWKLYYTYTSNKFTSKEENEIYLLWMLMFDDEDDKECAIEKCLTASDHSTSTDLDLTREAPACRPSLIKSINLFNVNEGEIEKKSIEQSSLSSDELNHSTDDPDRTREAPACWCPLPVGTRMNFSTSTNHDDMKETVKDGVELKNLPMKRSAKMSAAVEKPAILN